MREITTHRASDGGFNHKLKVVATGKVSGGGAHNVYVVEETHRPERIIARVGFHNSQLAEIGGIGITDEVLLAIVADRLEGFQRGPFASYENDGALQSVNDALEFLKHRTNQRIAHGVDGQQVPSPPPRPESFVALP